MDEQRFRFSRSCQSVKCSSACYTPNEMSPITYSLSGYGDMIADRVRIEAFTQALRGVIRPGAVVMDIGTGPGIMAVLACQLGASRGYAGEPSEVIQVAPESAAAKQMSDPNLLFHHPSQQTSN